MAGPRTPAIHDHGARASAGRRSPAAECLCGQLLVLHSRRDSAVAGHHPDTGRGADCGHSHRRAALAVTGVVGAALGRVPRGPIVVTPAYLRGCRNCLLRVGSRPAEASPPTSRSCQRGRQPAFGYHVTSGNNPLTPRVRMRSAVRPSDDGGARCGIMTSLQKLRGQARCRALQESRLHDQAGGCQWRPKGRWSYGPGLIAPTGWARARLER